MPGNSPQLADGGKKLIKREMLEHLAARRNVK
jgi:hypothetical protein